MKGGGAQAGRQAGEGEHTLRHFYIVVVEKAFCLFITFQHLSILS